MSGLGDLYDDGDPDSASRKNLKNIVIGTGDYLQSLNKTKFKWAICTEDSTDEELLADHAYMVNAAQNAFIDVMSISSHTHVNSTTGGTITDVYIANPKIYVLSLTNTDDLKKAQWIETVTSTGTIEDSTDGTTGERSIRLRTNGTSGATATISYPHLKLDFSASSMFQAKLQIETATSIALHSGVACDDTSAADSNTRKLQAEVCTATDTNWWLRTANGSANSASSTGIAITANRVGINIIHYPTLGTPRADLLIDAGTLLQKTTNIPTSGATADNNLVKHSVKNSTAADRPLKMYGSRLQYKVSDNWV